MPMGNKLFETDRIKRVLETIEKQDRLIASLNDKIETLSTQSQYNMKLDTDCIRELRTQVIKATPNMYEKERAVTMKMISDEYDQRTRVLEESKNRLIDHKNVMLTFSKRKELEQRARGLHHPVDYHISRWEQMWAEQGGEVKQAANKKKVEKSKKQLEFEVSQWSKECGMYAVFNEFLMDQILLADTRLAVVEATNADHHTTIEEMRKKCKIADNVRDARQQQEIDLLKQKYSDMVAVMMEQIVMLKGYQQIQLSENPTLEEKCEKMGNELNRMVANLPNSEKSQTLLEKENQELDKMDKEIDKQVDAVSNPLKTTVILSRIAALVNIRKEYHRKSALDILHSIKDCRSVEPMGSPLFTDEDQLITNLPPHLQKINNLNKSQQSQKPQKSEKIQMGGAPNIPKFPHEEINKIFTKVDKTQAAVLKEIIKKQEERLKILEDQVSEKSKIEDMSDEEKTRKIEELERKTKEMEEKMENYERKLVEKERQMAIIDNGYLQFGLGMTRFQSSAGRMPDDPMPKIDGKLGIRNVQGVYGNS
ncbi:Protein CBG26817 [Caenorhabditis briggsae]|uniref:Protein CBG26817 n=1 Tax=Caenorhabditis briggsae TaxID=6238 RepID=B6IJT6_CAEBR|nr:Protein CBG26817 [Caenorhabditis briggsae]CAS00166.1 Protein CBG26817 [Caenorhabditis briggsae]